MIDLLTVFLMLPIVYAAALEFADRKLRDHAFVSIVTSAVIALIYLVPALMAQLGLTNPLEIYGILLPQELSFLIVVLALVFSFGIYFLVVGVTKLIEAIVKGM